jgi:ATP-binding cassette subfamily F protein 3
VLFRSASIDALIGALESYEGTLIFISHDVYFIRQLAKYVLHVNNGELMHYHGDYQYYLEKSVAIAAAIAASAAPVAPPVTSSRPKGKEQKRSEAEARNVRSRERREQEQLVATLEKEIARLEQKQKELAAELEKPETYDKPGRAVAVNRELSAAAEDLTRATADWERAAARVNELKPALKPDLTPS